MYAPEVPAAGAYAQQQHFAQNYMPNFVMTPQVLMLVLPNCAAPTNTHAHIFFIVLSFSCQDFR
jgi:hypothetical protein